MSVPGGLALSAGISIGITLLLSGILAKLMDIQKLTWEQAGYWIMAMLFLSAFAGAKSAVGTVRRRRMAVSVMSGALYWGCLLCITALFFGGKFDAVPETALIIIAGSGCAAMISAPETRPGRNKKRKRKL